MVSTLVLSGHSLADVRRYTLRQAMGFLELVHTHRSMMDRNAAVSLRVAFHANKDQWASYLKDISNG